MSFILDALKKSESERQRQSGPALFEVKLAQPAARFPIWAVAIGLLLGINLVVLIVVMLMRDARGKADAAPNAAASAVTAATAPSAAAAPSTAVVPGPAPLPAPLPTTVPPTGSGPGPANNAPPNSAYNPPLVQDPTLGDGEAVSSTYTPRDYQPAEGPDPANSANGANAAGLGPAGTASTPIGGAAGPSGPRLSAAQRTGLPSRDDLVTAGNTQIPEVTLSLHVFDRIPANRFVFVNSQRAREGDSLPSGLKIEEITAEGAVLSFRGSRFLVPL